MTTAGAHLLAPVLLAFLAAPGPAQPSGVPTFGEVIDVRGIDHEVVVTAGGERVRGLVAADFRLEVDGEPVPIEFFAEVAGGTTAVSGAPVGRHLLVFVDDSFALPAERNRVLAAIARELPRLGPEDRMALVAFDGRRLELLAGFTRSLPQLQAAFEQARGRAAFGLQRRGEQRRFDAIQHLGGGSGASFSRTGFAGSTYASNVPDATGLARANELVTRVVSAGSAALHDFATGPGRKVMLLLAGGWPIAPASEPGSVAGRRLLAPLVDTANRLGYTLYPIDVPGTQTETVDESVTGFSVLDELAARTGGRVLLGGARLDPLGHVLRDLEHYYWLGFVPRWERDGRAHTVRVKLARPGLAVRARAGFVDPAHAQIAP